MKQVWKEIVPIDDQWHVIPGKIVHVGQQNDKTVLCVWFIAYEGRKPGFTGNTNYDTTVRVFGTGHRVPLDTAHVASVQDEQHGLVWHLFRMQQ